MEWMPIVLGAAVGAATPSGGGAKEGELKFWLENALVYHGFSRDEAAKAVGLPVEEVDRLIEALGIDPRHRPSRAAGDPLLVLPYPGGRHPRIGFLEGAIDPRRGTKASVFLPWKGSGYVVVDLPEAIWRPPDLIFLAHKHIPTIWEKRGVRLPRIAWRRGPGGRLAHRLTLPDGFAFGARILPGRDAVDMELWIRNGAKEPLRGLRAQICVMLKGAPGFARQTGENKVLGTDWAAVRSEDGRRWIATAWERGRPWQNPPVPCMHADPPFPDCAPGRTVRARGRIFFFEGRDIEAEIARRREAGTLFGRPAAEGAGGTGRPRTGRNRQRETGFQRGRRVGRAQLRSVPFRDVGR